MDDKWPRLSCAEILFRNLSPFSKQEDECRSWLLSDLEFYSISPPL